MIDVEYPGSLSFSQKSPIYGQIKIKNLVLNNCLWMFVEKARSGNTYPQNDKQMLKS